MTASEILRAKAEERRIEAHELGKKEDNINKTHALMIMENVRTLEVIANALEEGK